MGDELRVVLRSFLLGKGILAFGKSEVLNPEQRRTAGEMFQTYLLYTHKTLV